jgi:hypothetical protein
MEDGNDDDLMTISGLTFECQPLIQNYNWEETNAYQTFKAEY